MGGRVHSKKVGEEVVEWGAQFIHGQEGNVAYDLAERCGLVSQDNINWGDILAQRDDSTTVDTELVGLMYTVMNGEGSMEEMLENLTPEEASRYGSDAEFFRSSLDPTLEEWGLLDYRQEAWQYLAMTGRIRGTANGAPTWWDLKVPYPSKECPGNQFTVLKQGTTYQEFLEKVGGNVLDRVKLGEKVLKIRSSDDMVEVETEITRYQADYVIITVSLGVLKQAAIEFIPELPQQKLKLIDEFPFGVVDKVFVEYDTELADMVPNFGLLGINFLRLSEGPDSDPWLNTPSDLWQENVMGLYPDITNPRLMLIWLSGPAALQAEQLPAPTLLREVKTLLARFFPASHPLLSPRSAHITQWGTGNSTRGSYSYVSPTTPEGAHALLATPVGRVLFAGEATHSTHFSTVHGAMETGRREAGRILGMERAASSTPGAAGMFTWLAQLLGCQSCVQYSL